MPPPSLASRILSGARAVAAYGARLAADGLASPQARAPFQGGTQPPGDLPPIEWDNDQPAPPPLPLVYRQDYHGHTFRASTLGAGYEGFTLDRVRGAIAQHRQGIFFESSRLAVSICGFGPILAALSRRMAPIIRLPRHVNGGDRGIARVIREDMEEQLAPKAGLAWSPYFPETEWGALIFDRAFMNFFVLQHVAGEEDPETGIRKIWTRRWPTWAVTCMPNRHTFQAQTTEGPVDILNDGKFTLGADIADPHLTASICALGEEALDGKQTQRARASYIRKYGNPKWLGEMPEGIAPDTDIGRALFAAMKTVGEQDGVMLAPHASKVDIKGLTGSQTSAFADAFASNLAVVAMIMDGSDGPSAPTSAGVYPSPHKFEVANWMKDRDLKCVVRAVNVGHVATSIAVNHAAEAAEADARGIWKDPVFEIGPLPDPEEDARSDADAKRQRNLYDTVMAERGAGGTVDQDRVNRIAVILRAEPFMLSDAKGRDVITEADLKLKLYAPDEAREQKGYDPMPDDAGSLARLAAERIAGKDYVGKVASAVDPNAPSADPLGGGETVPAGSLPADGAEQTNDAPTGDDGPATGQEGGE